MSFSGSTLNFGRVSNWTFPGFFSWHLFFKIQPGYIRISDHAVLAWYKGRLGFKTWRSKEIPYWNTYPFLGSWFIFRVCRMKWQPQILRKLLFLVLPLWFSKEVKSRSERYIVVVATRKFHIANQFSSLPTSIFQFFFTHIYIYLDMRFLILIYIFLEYMYM